MSTNPLESKTALVTGVTGGLGQNIARALKQVGCHVVGTARNTESLYRFAAESGIIVVPADLAEASGPERLGHDVNSIVGTVDILVNCAGVFPVGKLADSSIDSVDRCLAINLRSPLILCRTFGPLMVRKGWGRIVNFGSSSAYSGFRDTVAYCASKHALLGLTRALHEELKTANVRCFCVSPGSVQTEMGRKVPNQDFATFINPEEVARLIIHLISYDGNMVAEEIRLNRMEIR